MIYLTLTLFGTTIMLSIALAGMIGLLRDQAKWLQDSHEQTMFWMNRELTLQEIANERDQEL